MKSLYKMYLFHDCELLVSFETINKIELILAAPMLSEGDQRPLITLAVLTKYLNIFVSQQLKYFYHAYAGTLLSLSQS